MLEIAKIFLLLDLLPLLPGLDGKGLILLGPGLGKHKLIHMLLDLIPRHPGIPPELTGLILSCLPAETGFHVPLLEFSATLMWLDLLPLHTGLDGMVVVVILLWLGLVPLHPEHLVVSLPA